MDRIVLGLLAVCGAVLAFFFLPRTLLALALYVTAKKDDLKDDGFVVILVFIAVVAMICDLVIWPTWPWIKLATLIAA